MIKIYRSKISYGLLMLLLIIFYFPFQYFNNEKSENSFNLWSIIINTVVFLLIIYLFYDTKYTINHNLLKIKLGPFYNQEIDINTIKRITKTRSFLAAPASSLDRIKIEYGKYDSVIISPKDKQNFIIDLMKINPKITHNITF